VLGHPVKILSLARAVLIGLNERVFRSIYHRQETPYHKTNSGGFYLSNFFSKNPVGDPEILVPPGLVHHAWPVTESTIRSNSDPAEDWYLPTGRDSPSPAPITSTAIRPMHNPSNALFRSIFVFIVWCCFCVCVSAAGIRLRILIAYESMSAA